jgi:hypothetical protein
LHNCWCMQYWRNLKSEHFMHAANQLSDIYYLTERDPVY